MGARRGGPPALWGVLFLALTAAGSTQQMLAIIKNCFAADTAAVGALAARYAKKDLEQSGEEVMSARAARTTISNVLLENLAQLYLQVSFYVLIFEKLTRAGRAKLLFSMALGLLGASKKLLELAIGLCSRIVKGHPSVDDLVCFSLLPCVPGLVMVCWVCASRISRTFSRVTCGISPQAAWLAQSVANLQRAMVSCASFGTAMAATGPGSNIEPGRGERAADNSF